MGMKMPLKAEMRIPNTVVDVCEIRRNKTPRRRHIFCAGSRRMLIVDLCSAAATPRTTTGAVRSGRRFMVIVLAISESHQLRAAASWRRTATPLASRGAPLRPGDTLLKLAVSVVKTQSLLPHLERHQRGIVAVAELQLGSNPANNGSPRVARTGTVA